MDFIDIDAFNPHIDELRVNILKNAGVIAQVDDRWRRSKLKMFLKDMMQEMDVQEYFKSQEKFERDFPKYVWAIGQLSLIDYMNCEKIQAVMLEGL